MGGSSSGSGRFPRGVLDFPPVLPIEALDPERDLRRRIGGGGRSPTRPSAMAEALSLWPSFSGIDPSRGTPSPPPLPALPPAEALPLAARPGCAAGRALPADRDGSTWPGSAARPPRRTIFCSFFCAPPPRAPRLPPLPLFPRLDADAPPLPPRVVDPRRLRGDLALGEAPGCGAVSSAFFSDTSASSCALCSSPSGPSSDRIRASAAARSASSRTARWALSRWSSMSFFQRSWLSMRACGTTGSYRATLSRTRASTNCGKTSRWLADDATSWAPAYLRGEAG